MVVHQNQVGDGKGYGCTGRDNDAIFGIQLEHYSDLVWREPGTRKTFQ